MMIQVNDRWCRVAVTTAGRTTAAASVTGQLTRAGGRLVSSVPFG
jgi:hypothetical protein